MKKHENPVKNIVKADSPKVSKANKSDSLQNTRAHVFKSQFQKDEDEEVTFDEKQDTNKKQSFEFNEIKNQNEEIKFLKSELERLKISEQNHFDSLVQINQISGTLEKVLPDFLHELSSPIALLEYSLENLMLDYQKVIKILTELAFNSQAKDSTLDLLNYVQSLNIDYSKKTNNIESREKRKIISDALASYKFKHTHRAADYMIIAGINEINENLDTILKSTEGEKLFELLISFISVNQSFSILDTAKLRARNLISTLKNYTRKKNSSGTNTFDLKTSIDVALLMMGHQLRSRNFEFNYEANCFLDADIQKLSNVWINLLSHAIESTNCSGQIILKVFTVENQVMVTLEDNGKIVTPEHIKQLQNSDYSSNLSENISKLFTCKKYLDTINAKLSIDSNQQSTLFTITFSDYATSEK